MITGWRFNFTPNYEIAYVLISPVCHGNNVSHFLCLIFISITLQYIFLFFFGKSIAASIISCPSQVIVETSEVLSVNFMINGSLTTTLSSGDAFGTISKTTTISDGVYTSNVTWRINGHSFLSFSLPDKFRVTWSLRYPRFQCSSGLHPAVQRACVNVPKVAICTTNVLAFIRKC